MKLPTLIAEQLTHLNNPFTEQEIIATIKTLLPGKAPGPDGLTREYFKQFSHQLAPHLTALFNDAASSSLFPRESLQALIVTLPKPGKEPEAPQNVRPISLLNLNLKIYAKTIATRLLNIMPTLIHRD